MSDSLRPNSFSEYIGQRELIREMDVRIRAARATGKPLEHILLIGTPGSGKTALASIIGAELGEETEILNCPVNIKTLTKVVRIHSGILVLDEIHSLNPSTMEALMPLLEWGYLALPSGQRITADWLTVIGTTTERHKIIPPLWDRFASKPPFAPYSVDDLSLIVLGMAMKQGVELDDAGLQLFASASLGVPRVARNLVVAYHSLLAAAQDAGEVQPCPEDALLLLQMQSDGLTPDHLRYMSILDLLGGTAGLNPISSLLNLHKGIVPDLERVLIERGYLTLTERGREMLKPGFVRLREYEQSLQATSHP